MAKKKSNSKIFFIIIILILLFVVFKDKISFGDDSNKCGDMRSADENRSGYCTTSAKDYDQLVIITGNTANSPAPELDFDKDLAEIISGVFYNAETGNEPDISIISASGNGKNPINFRNYKPAKNLSASNSNLKKLKKEINEKIKQSPEESGADYFGALLSAKAKINKNAKRPLILIIGSGYSDRGVLDFTSRDILGNYASNGDISYLTSNNVSLEKGMLEGVSIIWRNIGSVTSPQHEVGDNNRKYTKNFYSSVFEYLGVEDCDITEGGTASKESVDTNYTVGQIYVNKLIIGDSFDLNEKVGKFVPDGAELENEDEVRAKLRAFASQFDNGAGYRLRVTGYINTSGSCGNDSISLPRAQKIKEILITLGVSADKIDVVGLPGSPSVKSGEEYTCNCPLSAEECRTVKIEVVEG